MRYLRDVMNGFTMYRHLLGNLVRRDIKVKYRRSALGIIWSVLNPLLMMLVMKLVFETLFDMKTVSNVQVVRGTDQGPVFAMYLLSGQLVFNFFSESTSLAMDSVLGSAPLIKKVYIPKYIFPLEKVIFSFVNTLFSLTALVIVLVFTRSPIFISVLWFPAVLVLLFFFNLGIGLILSALTVFFRDIKHFYGVIVMALNYLTPIFYNEGIFSGGEDKKMAEIMFYVLRANPLFWYVSMFRRVVVFGYNPTIQQWIACFGWAIIALAFGLLIFKKAQDRFILYV